MKTPIEDLNSSGNDLRVAMFAPVREQCGVSDYTRLLVDGLRTLPNIADVRMVETPGEQIVGSHLDALRRFRSEEARFRAIGAQLNANADVAHIQHQYFFFGGVAPHKNHARAFLDAIRVPVVLTIHEIVQAGQQASMALSPAKWLTNRRNFIHPAIRAIIVHTKDDFVQLLDLGVKQNLIHVLLHPTPPPAPMPTMEDAKRAFDLTGRRVVTLFGFLATKKGHFTALEALQALPEDVVLVFAGGQHPQDHTDYVDSLRRYITAHHLENRVRMTGYLDEVQIPIVMAATDVAIAPFTHTSGSGSLANLFAYGRAVVASDIEPHKYLIGGYPGCLELFHVYDAGALAANVHVVLENAERRSRLQQSALAYARQHSYLEMARQTAEIYQGVRDKSLFRQARD